MKLIYQNMLGFLLIIVTTISIIGYSEIGYARDQAYMQNYQRMEGYANSLGNLAAAEGKDDTAILSNSFLNQLEFILRGDDVHLRIFNEKNEQIYPKTREKIQLSKNIFATLGRHIIATRSIPLDQVRYGRDIQEQYYFLNKVTQQKLLEYITKDNVEEKMKRKESRDVSITSILKMQENTYQVRWTENNYTDTGNIYSTVPMVGMFTVEYITPQTEDMLMVNSLGIIITDFSYSQEM